MHARTLAASLNLYHLHHLHHLYHPAVAALLPNLPRARELLREIARRRLHLRQQRVECRELLAIARLDLRHAQLQRFLVLRNRLQLVSEALVARLDIAVARKAIGELGRQAVGYTAVRAEERRDALRV